MKSAEHMHAPGLQGPAQAPASFKWTALALVFVACLYASDAFAQQAGADTPLPPAQTLNAP